MLTHATTPGLSAHEARDDASARKRRRAWQMLGIRIVSVVVVLALWQYVGSGIDPVLFTTPSAVARAAYGMLRSGELWTYLWPSLVIFAVGLTIAAIVGVAIGLLLARFWVIDVAFGVYITFLYSIPAVALVPLIVLWAGFEIDREDHRAVSVRVLPDGDQHLPGREERRSAPASRSAARSAARSASSGPTSCCPARCRSSSPACASRSAAA